MIKKIVPLLLLTTISSSVMANNSNAITDDATIDFRTSENEPYCKHNALHYATSIEDIIYVKAILERKEFTLQEYNKQCQTVFHIATELGNIELLKLFYDYLGTFDIGIELKNNLMQQAIRHHQPEVLLFFIDHGFDPNQKNSEGQDSFYYQDKYGNNLTQRILDEYDNKSILKNIENKMAEKDIVLQKLHDEIKNKEKELLRLKESNNSPESNKQIESLTKEIEALKLYIQQLENIIKSQEKIINNFKNKQKEDNKILHNIASKNKKTKDILETHIPEGKEHILLKDNKKLDDVDMLELSKNKDDDVNLTELSNQGEVLDDTMKLFELLSKPIYKIEKK